MQGCSLAGSSAGGQEGPEHSLAAAVHRGSAAHMGCAAAHTDSAADRAAGSTAAWEGDTGGQPAARQGIAVALGRHTLALGPSTLQGAQSVAAGTPAPTSAGYAWERCWAAAGLPQGLPLPSPRQIVAMPCTGTAVAVTTAATSLPCKQALYVHSAASSKKCRGPPGSQQEAGSSAPEEGRPGAAPAQAGGVGAIRVFQAQTAAHLPHLHCIGVQHPSHSTLISPRGLTDPPLLPCHSPLTQILVPTGSRQQQRIPTQELMKHKKTTHQAFWQCKCSGKPMQTASTCCWWPASVICAMRRACSLASRCRRTSSLFCLMSSMRSSLQGRLRVQTPCRENMAAVDVLNCTNPQGTPGARAETKAVTAG